jgi:SRSO17 transposase
MSLPDIIWDGQEERFAQYLYSIGKALGHADRHDPFQEYCIGLLLPGGDRKNLEQIAARIAPDHVCSTHYSLRHFVADSSWNDKLVLKAVCEQVLPAIQRHGKITSWIIDDTGMPKKGDASVGVSHQYCGNLGKQANCQVAVSLSIANDFASLPIAYQLYLPQKWTDDPERCRSAKIPNSVGFATKPQIALEQVRQAKHEGIPIGIVIADAGYGNNTPFRDGIAALGLHYCVAVQKNILVWESGKQALPPKRKKKNTRGRPATRLRHTAKHTPVQIETFVRSLPTSAFRSVSWRQGTKELLCSRFAAVRIRIAHDDVRRSIPRSEEWLLIEWPTEENEPRKYWVSNLPPTTSRKTLVQYAQSRWRIERDYQELKDELGLDHYEGRGWRGFHHHATLCIAAYGFLIKEKSAALVGDFSPSTRIRQALTRRIPPLSPEYKPRGSPCKT